MNKFEILQNWSLFKNCVRSFFLHRGYLEVDTPLLSPFLIPEPAIEVFKTFYSNPYGDDREGFLIPSPELWMKRLLGMGAGDIFQIGKCFRNRESLGDWHNPEFTMLEWYTCEADYKESINTVKELFNWLVENFSPARESVIARSIETLTMSRAFAQYAGLNLEELWSPGPMAAAAESKGINCSPGDTWEVMFNKIFLTFIEPFLPGDHPVILTDYPAAIPCLAKSRGPVLERWELYLRGIETANCYTEETDRENVEQIIKEEDKRKKKEGVISHPPDRELSGYFHQDYPPCSGGALGMERLFMAIMKIDSIKGVIFFPFSDIFGLK